MVSFEESTRAGGGGYTIEGLRSVVVKVDADTLANAAALDALAIRDPQADAFLAQAAQITFDETIDPDTVYAVKELLANGIYDARTVDPNGQARDPGRVWVGDGTNDSKRIANNDGYADLTVYIYFDQYADYTKGSIADLTEATLDGLYADQADANTYAANKAGGDALAAFMHYALHYQGAKLQWAGSDGVFDTADDVSCGNMLHKDSYFSFNHGNYIEVSITNDFARFQGLGNGDYRITLIADGYRDAVVEAHDLVLDYRTPSIVEEDVPALAEGEDTLTIALDARTINVSLDDAVEAAYVAALANEQTYQLCYTVGKGRKAQTVVLADTAAHVAEDDGIYTVTFDVSATKAQLPVDEHCTVVLSTKVGDIADSTVSLHYAPAD
ncbi:MAG: hypothetical protein Q4D31_01145 [Eubacteriales bacterium]|nr:hypothetical protein [Eubacteriales bacterium]